MLVGLDRLRALFQSTLSVRRATLVVSSISSQQKFQSTLSVRRATEQIPSADLIIRISIHALREESDRTRPVNGNDTANFNPRSP